MGEIDIEELLAGLEGDARAERRELLEHLVAEDHPSERILQAAESGLLSFLPAERAVTGDPVYTQAEVAERAQIDLEILLRLRRAYGLPVADPAAVEFTDADVDAAQVAKGFIDAGINETLMLATGRVLGRGLGQSAEVMRSVVLELALEPGATEKELALRYATIVEALTPMLGPLLDGLLRLHLREMVATEAVDAVERATGSLPGAREVTVCFADLVGFTRMGEEVPPEELGAVADRLVSITEDTLRGSVRLVKTIGDAAMLVAPDPAELVAVALDLVDNVDAQGADFPQVHVGIAHGPALNRGGDWFGSSVNTASRVTAVARAGSVLATEDVTDAGESDAVRWSYAGERKLKGLQAPVKLFRARRPAASS